MKALLFAAGLLVIGCGVTVSDGERTSDGTGNGNGSGSGNGNGNGGVDAGTNPVNPPDAAPTCSNGRVIYLNYGGVTLKSTQAKSDATNNAAFWAGSTLHVPAFRANSATRASDITAITAAITAALSQFPITVVTTRPTTGPYVMVAFGGKSKADFGFDTEYYAIDSLDCGDAWASDVAWVGDIAPSNTLAADFALGAIGFGLGLSGTLDPNDCMCGWGSSCDSADVACTFSTIAAAPLCQGAANPQDEIGAFDTAFCKPLN